MRSLLRAPFLHVSALVALCLSLSACSDSNGNEQNKTIRGQLSFTPVSVTTTVEEKHAVRASSEVTINQTAYPIGYQTILRSGQQLGEQSFGQLIDVAGNPLMNRDGSPSISSSNDFTSFLQVNESLYMVTQFESRPGGVYLTEIQQNPQTGLLKALKTRPLDFSHVDGGWMHCAGSVTPWNTHLGGEEYPPEASWVNPKTGDGGGYYNYQARYFGGDLKKLNPYHYGYQFEVGVKNFDQATVTKHYSMGRISHELAFVMPDQKTAYLSDDNTNGVFLRFLADKPGDLSSGELFAARWEQISAENGGAANLGWISLGKANDQEIHALIQQDITFSDIFERSKPTRSGTCSDPSFSFANTGNNRECLKIKPGMAKVASRLETRRYAALKGATSEFRKLEGITLDPTTNRLYVSASSIQKGMQDGHEKNDLGGPNHIRLPKNKCGSVFRLELDKNYIAKSIKAEISGMPVKRSYGAADNTQQYDPNGPLARNSCHLDHIANPDNLSIAPERGVLFIGEDSGSGHQNDAVWAYDLNTKNLTRILATPYGSEATSVYYYPDIKGWSYLMTVVQHPYGESDQDKSRGNGDIAAYNGYIGPFPAH